MVLYYAALDFECTCCDQTPQTEWLNEIIEFPVVFVNSCTLNIDYTFHSYVRPTEQSILTNFCTQLTGIIQDEVDPAPALCDVLDMFQNFLDDHGLKPIGRLSKKQAQSIITQQRLISSSSSSSKSKCSNNNNMRISSIGEHNQFVILLMIVGTDGPWDIFKFLVPECLRKRITIPQWALHYADVRRHFQYALRLEKWCSISYMLEILGLSFQGRQHSGIDDATNIATIIITLANNRSQTMFTNRHVDVHSTPDIGNASLILNANPTFYSNINWDNNNIINNTNLCKASSSPPSAPTTTTTTTVDYIKNS